MQRLLAVVALILGSLLVQASSSQRNVEIEQTSGVVVEEVGEDFAAHKAGLEPGDLLLHWVRAASPPANPEPASGELDSPFDLDDVEMEEILWGSYFICTGVKK